MLTKLLQGLNLQQSLVKDIMCEPHKQMALFYSDEQKKYKCGTCLLEESGLHFVDDNYQSKLEDFDRIKARTAEIIKKDEKKMDLMKNWKNQIRKSLIKTRNDFVDWVDVFTTQFIRSLKTIEG